MARKQLEDATLEDLEQIFKEHGHKPQIAYGLAFAARKVWSPFFERKANFLLGFLDQEYSPDPPYVFPLVGEIYGEVVRQLLGDDLSSGLSGKQLHRLVNFLGQYPPLGGIRGKVGAFLAMTSRLMTAGHYFPAAPTTLDRGSLARALLRYQAFDVLEQFFVEGRIYEGIPALFDAVVEQAGEEKSSYVEMAVWSGWRPSASDSITELFRAVGSDTRALRLLIDLSQAYIDQHGTHYPTEELQ